MKNLLPFDGNLFYFPNAIPVSATLFARLMKEIPWQNETVRMFGKQITMRRMVSWHADEGLTYSYSGIRKTASAWTDALLEMKSVCETLSKAEFNSCLLNLYPEGRDSMGWHSDNEKELGPDPLIASVSLGAARPFSLRHTASGETVSIMLEHRSILFMGSGVQKHWKHSLPPMNKISTPRINLTFRKIFNEL